MAPDAMGASPEAGSASAWTHTMPLTLHTCTQPSWSEEATTACATVGANAPSTMASMASQAVKRRWARANGIGAV